MSNDARAADSCWPTLINNHLTWSVLVTDDDGRELLAFDPDGVLAAASIGKLLLLVEAAEQLAIGAVDGAELLSRTEADSVADSGIWQTLGSNHLSVADVAVLIGSVSDNLATNVLLRRIGLDAVAQRATTLGLTQVALHDQVRDVRGPDDPPRLSSGNATDLVRLIRAIADGDGVSDEAAVAVQSSLRFNCDLSMVAAPWHLDPLAHHTNDHGWLLLNKTGTNAEVRGDVGVVSYDDGSTSRRVAYAVLANGAMTDPDQRTEALTTMAAIGRGIAQYLATD